ncbi:MAG TPA: hypothetical protein VF624_15555 [Tepidisphaeraceae bacterium]|jgi:8-oxo-dGTP pyrophosphatase MutT (NUDIX family)
MSDPDNFRFLLRKRFAEGSVHARWTPSTRAILPPVDAAIDAAWHTLKSRPGVHLFDGPVCRFESFTVAGDRLTLAISETSYRLVAGTNFANPHFAIEHGRGVMANPLGVSTLLHTADKFLMLGRRNHTVAYYPGRVHPFAGSMEVRERVDPFDNVRRELAEELGLTAPQIKRIVCLGLAEDAALLHPELIFVTDVAESRAGIAAALDLAEHSLTWSIDARPAVVDAALDDPALTPIAKAVLTAWADDVQSRS